MVAVSELLNPLALTSSSPRHPPPTLGLPPYSAAKCSFTKLILTPKSTACTTRRNFSVYSSLAQTDALEIQVGDTGEDANIKKKLHVGNLPWKFSVAEIKELFSVCGTVADVEMIKIRDGKSRRFAFITMTSGEEAQAVLEKFDSYEVSGRTIRIDFAKRLKKPPPKTDSNSVIVGETRHQLYASNLAWKVRGSHLREIFSSTFQPVSCRVVFDKSSGRSAGYGFVSFATKEEAEAALSAFHGKDLMGRPLRLRLNENSNEEAEES